MGITSTEIREVGFEHSLRGYDIEQVDVFLEKVAVAVEGMNLEIEDLREKLAEAGEGEGAVAGELPEAGVEAEAETDTEPERQDAPAPAVDAEDLERISARAESAESDLADALARLREAERQAAEARTRIAELEEELKDKEDREKVISNAFISAQRSADQLKEEARAEGERIYRESEQKARDLIREALVKKQQVFGEIEALESSCDKFRRDYKRMLERFTAEADSHFTEVPAASIPDGIVNELLEGSGSAEGDGQDAERTPVFSEDIPALPTVEMDPVEGGAEVSSGDLDIEDVD